MEAQSLQIEIRQQNGKNAARQLRMRGLLPGVIYGQKSTPTSVTVSANELFSLLSTEYGKNVLLKLQLGNREEFAVVKELQVDPIYGKPLHVDFCRVDLESPIEVRVPFKPLGQPKGVLAGGEMNVVFRAIPIRVKPSAIPPFIEADVSALDIHEMLQAKDLKLPKGIDVLLDSDRTLVAIAAERKEVVEQVEGEIAAAPTETAETKEGEGAAKEGSKADGKSKGKTES
ncbi:MAG: 50S ribosomal protein L25 [Deltaproteobacteria bacterium]|nr:50S ribosomal protein L25 [Deltaproteobacteria bacterium]